MSEVYTISSVLAPEDLALDCGAWLLWVEPGGVHCAAGMLPEGGPSTEPGPDALFVLAA